MAEVEDVRRITGTTAKTAARLCNFVTAKSFLLTAHQDYLDNEVAPIIRRMQGSWVDLFGYASRAGDAGYNMGLSHDRLNAVKARIEQYANQVNFQIQVGFGETESGPNERDNAGYWRAVEVYVYAFQPKPPKPTPQEITRRMIKRSFSKMDAKADLQGPNAPSVDKDAINDLLKLGLAAAQGKLTAEGLLGKEDSKEIQGFPANFRVNKVTFDTKRSLDQSTGGSVVQESTTIRYEWGPPTPNVIIDRRFQFTWNGDVRPAEKEVTTMPRGKAEAMPLIVPPDP